MASSPHVGTLREKPLHASLKRWYAESGDGVEVPVGGYVIDLVRNDLLIEIQTRGFSAMKRKLAALLALGHAVRIVHPIPELKWIVRCDDRGDEIGRRRSPKRGGAVDIFGELVSFPSLLAEPELELELLLVHEEEYRRHEPGRAWRRHGWVVTERRLVGVVDAVPLRTPRDLLRFLPRDIAEPFTTGDLATALRRPRRLAQQMAYCLRELGMIEAVGKDGNAIAYAVA